ncbi:DNA phosphorothioation-dependent restriction protein DptF [Natronorubrum aibiense]|nr:DNA phosphorothioation-dependent restriction protein DptF [Natronorubrum aibiense]
MGEAGAIVGGHIDRNSLRQGLYVSTKEDDLVKSFFVDDYIEDGKLLIITGSAGDGKSALLSRAYRLAQEEGIDSLTETDIHMDATASTQKTKTYDETLSEFFDTAIQRINEGEGPRSGVAINLGLAIDFFERKGKKEKYQEIWDAIEGAKPQRTNEKVSIRVLNLSHRQLFRTQPDHFGEGLLREIVDKFDASDPESPFYEAFQFEKEECPAHGDCPLHYNMERFTDDEVRANIARLLAAKSLIENSYLNPRRILDYLASILLPPTLESIAKEDSACPIGRSIETDGKITSRMMIWNSVFQIIDDHDGERSGHLDPSAQSEKEIDLRILEWAANPSTLDEILESHPTIANFSIEEKIQTTLRKQYLEGKQREQIRTAIEWSWFTDFLGAYTYLNRDTSEEIDPQVEKELKNCAVNMNQTLTDALKGWSGKHTNSNYIEFVDGIKTTDYRFLAQWSNPSPNREKSRQRTKRETTPGQLWFVLEPEQANTEVPIPISFELYVLMKRISMGYNPNVRDLERSEGIRLIHSRLSEFTDKQNSVRIVNKNGEELLSVEKGAFDGIKIRGKGQ